MNENFAEYKNLFINAGLKLKKSLQVDINYRDEELYFWFSVVKIITSRCKTIYRQNFDVMIEKHENSHALEDIKQAWLQFRQAFPNV
ncbi:MAG: hypothetical protein SNJ71_00255 [Bacteroidales bacterium]